MVSTTNYTYGAGWSGGDKTYVSAAEVLQFLKLYDTYTSTTQYNNDIFLLNNIIIPQVCDYIDVITGRTWGIKSVVNEHYSIGKPAYLGWYLVGSPVYMAHYPIYSASSTNTVSHLGVWNGTQYEEWVGTMVEARWGSYWFDTSKGILWIIGWYWYMGYEIEISYNYGYGTAGTNQMDGQIYNLALYKSAKLFFDNERYTAQVSEGVGGIEMQKFYESIDNYIKQLEDAVKGYKVPVTSWLP